MYLNRVQLIGNLGKDPEVRTFQSGGSVCSLSVATSESWKDKNTGERKTRTQWHNVQIFVDHLVNLVKGSAAKGDRIFVEGTLETRKWQDNTGADRYTTEVVVRPFGGQVILLSPRRQEADEDPAPRQQSMDTRPAARKPAPTRHDMDDEIPFAWAAIIPLLGSLVNLGGFA